MPRFLARADFVACSSCNWEDPLGREKCQVSSIPIAKIENRCLIFFLFFSFYFFLISIPPPPFFSPFSSPPPPPPPPLFFPLLQFSKCNAGADKTTRLVLVLRSMAFVSGGSFCFVLALLSLYLFCSRSLLVLFVSLRV